MGLLNRWVIRLLTFALLLVIVSGWFLEIMAPEAAGLALLSIEAPFTQLLENGSYAYFPPLFFWIQHLFFSAFGAHDWVFRLPVFIMSGIGVIATYKLGHLLYNKRIGFIAAIILFSTQGFLLFNHNLNLEAFAMPIIVYAVWQWMAYVYYNMKRNLLKGSVATGLAVLAYGWWGLLLPVIALVIYFIGRNYYRPLKRWGWIFAMFVIFAVVILGVLPSLMKQGFDSDVFSFMGYGFGKASDPNPQNLLFYIHTFGWMFLPWSILAFWAIGWRFFNTIGDMVKGKQKQEWLTLGGFLLPLIVLTFSPDKLPKYLYLILPFAAIITSEFILRAIFEKPLWWRNAILGIQLVTVAVLLIGSEIVIDRFFPSTQWYVWVMFGLLAATSLGFFFAPDGVQKVVVSSALAIFAANVVLNFRFYPELMKYQPGKEIAEKIGRENCHLISDDYILTKASVKFYLWEYRHREIEENECTLWLFEEDAMVQMGGTQMDTLMVQETYPVSKLSLNFLLPKYRVESTTKLYLLKTQP